MSIAWDKGAVLLSGRHASTSSGVLVCKATVAGCAGVSGIFNLANVSFKTTFKVLKNIAWSFLKLAICLL